MRGVICLFVTCLAVAASFTPKECSSSICRENTVFDMLQLTPSLSNLTKAVISSSDVKSVLKNPEAKLTIFAPVDNFDVTSEAEFKSLLARAVKPSATDDDRRSLANHLKGHVISGVGIQIAGAGVHLTRTGEKEEDRQFRISDGEPQCQCTGVVDESEDETTEEDDKEADSNKEPEEVEDTEDKEPKTVEKEAEEPYTCECNAYNFGKLTLAREDAAGGGIVVTNANGKKANLLVENILASNGVIHLIDRVLF